MSYLFTSESVSEGHPDKVADQISDAILDEYLKRDPNSKVACETLVTTNKVIVSGEINSLATTHTHKKHLSTQQIKSLVRRVIRDIGYTNKDVGFSYDTCEIEVLLHQQSKDINRGVKDGGAGDQGMMFGYANSHSSNLMPTTLNIAHRLVEQLAFIRKKTKQIPYLRPDSKSQVTIQYGEDNTPKKIKTIVLSTQHDEFVLPKKRNKESAAKAEEQMIKKIKKDIIQILIPATIKKLGKTEKKLFDGFNAEENLLVNPTGKFVIGGPTGDTGLTGRKIIVDTYGGKGAHGGGAFSGKDSSKVDRSAAYAARHIAKNLVKHKIAKEVLVQLAYAIGKEEPVSVYVNTFNTSKIPDKKISQTVQKIFPLKPNQIIKEYDLKKPIFRKTAAYGHMGRSVKKQGDKTYFKWEETSRFENKIKKAFFS